MRISDETLSAYVDGELDEVERARVDAAARTDAALARRIQAHQRLRERMAGAFATLVNETPPDHLVEAIRGPRPDSRSPATVVDLEAARRARMKPAETKTAPAAWLRWGALAACVVLAIGVASRFAPPTPAPPPSGAVVAGPPGAMVARGVLADALEQQLASAGGRPGDAVRIGVSFQSNEGAYCRTFQTLGDNGFAGLACREPEGWRIRTTVAQSTSAPAGVYRQAATDTPPAVMASVDSLISGSPLDAQAEAAARAKAWKP